MIKRWWQFHLHSLLLWPGNKIHLILIHLSLKRILQEVENYTYWSQNDQIKKLTNHRIITPLSTIHRIITTSLPPITKGRVVGMLRYALSPFCTLLVYFLDQGKTTTCVGLVCRVTKSYPTDGIRGSRGQCNMDGWQEDVDWNYWEVRNFFFFCFNRIWEFFSKIKKWPPLNEILDLHLTITVRRTL